MGKVYLIGAGPGDPGLLTIKAGEILAKADVVIYDKLVSAEVLALANPSAKFIFAGKQKGDQQSVQKWIHELLLDYAPMRDIVVRLKGGDPMVFGRGAEEWVFLADERIDVEIVPGVSSAISVPALAGIPLTCRGIAASFAVIAGHTEAAATEDWSRYTTIHTLVVLMAVANRDKVARGLIDAGRSAGEPVAFIERGSTDREKVVETTLGEVARGAVHDIHSPAVMVIGQVVRLRRLLKSRNKSIELETVFADACKTAAA